MESLVTPPAAPAEVKLRPGTRAALWLCAALLLGLLAPRGLGLVWMLGFDAALVCLAVVDVLRLRGAKVWIERRVDGRMRMGAETQLQLHVRNDSRLRLRIALRDEAPEALRVTPELHRFQLAPGAATDRSAQVLALRRGTAQFEPVSVRVESRLGLASLVLRCGQPERVRVFPANALAAEATQAQRRELGEVAQRLRRSTQGNTLESLREYVASDPLRAIDWKATARRHRPVTRQYQPERSQTLWLVLDASRTMASAIGAPREPQKTESVDAAQPSEPGLSKTRFDVALESALALADSALHAGDQVGVLVYGDARQRLVAPGRGRAHYLRLLEAAGDAQAAPVQLRVRGLLAELEQRAPKRSLVVLFTDLENETHGGALAEHAGLLTRRHLTVCVSLHDAYTQERVARLPNNDAQVFQRAAAMTLLEERLSLRKRLESRGVVVLEADARGLAHKVLDHYLHVKLEARL